MCLVFRTCQQQPFSSAAGDKLGKQVHGNHGTTETVQAESGSKQPADNKQQQQQQNHEPDQFDEWEDRLRTRGRTPPAAAAAAAANVAAEAQADAAPSAAAAAAPGAAGRPSHAATASDYSRWFGNKGAAGGVGGSSSGSSSADGGSGSGGAPAGKSGGSGGGGKPEWGFSAAGAAVSWTSRGGARPGAAAPHAAAPGAPTAAAGAAPGNPFRLVQRSGGVETVISVAGRGQADYRIELAHRNARMQQHAAALDDFKAAAERSGRSHASGPPPAGAPRSNALQLMARRMRKQVMNTFLPSGYPASVGPHYLQYSLWQAATNVATTANGVLASTFLLYAVGLGAGAIPTAGAMNWVLKDGLGQLGTLLFGKAIAHNFDIHSKSWYFLSFVLLSTATGMEIATILVPNAFLVLGSCANMVKGLSWMAGGSTRSVFNLSFVRDNNIADITAKNTSQYIFASLFGTALGVSICAYIGQSAPLALACFSLLTGAALYSAFRTVQAIPLPTLNSTRLQLLTSRYLKCVRRANTAAYGGAGGGASAPSSAYINYQREYEVPDDDESTCARDLPTPLELAEQDPPLPWFMGDQRILNPDIRVGTSFDRMVGRNADLMVTLMTTFRYSRYLLLPTREAIHLVLHQEAQPRDIVTAYLQACILRKRLKTGLPASSDNLPELRIILHDTMLTAEKLTGPLMDALSRQGWQTEKIVVEAHRRRAQW